MWSHRHSSFEWSYSTVANAYKKFGHAETSGNIGLHNSYTKSCLIRLLLKIFFLLFSFWVKQLLRNKLVSTARESIRQNANLSQLYRSMQEAYTEMQTPLVYQTPAARLVRVYISILIEI